METVLQEVQDHLQKVTQDPSLQLDKRLLGKLDTSIIGMYSPIKVPL